MNAAAGLPWTSYTGKEWHNRGWWYDRLPTPGHAGYLVGQMLYYLLYAYEAEKEQTGTAHEEWLAFVKKCLPALERAKNSDGEYPYVFSQETGAGLSYDSMGGAWCLAAAAFACRYEKSSGGVASLLKSEMHYYTHYVKRMLCYGGPLDIDKQIDSEGVLAYVRAVRRLHEETGLDYLLDHMQEALEYEFTFKFCYNAPVQVPPLSRGWSSCGGSITSLANPHIHPMSSSVVEEMQYLLDRRPDDYIHSRMQDTVAWGLQTFARREREYDYGRIGWMSERFCYSQGLLTQRYADGSVASTWFALMPWAVGSVLEGLCPLWNG